MRGKVSPGPNMPPVDAERVDVTRSDEKWNEYTLSDGTKLRVKPVVTEVWRVEGNYDADGNPLYLSKTAMVQAVEVPESLKRKLQ
jgi:hypothetical protein